MNKYTAISHQYSNNWACTLPSLSQEIAVRIQERACLASLRSLGSWLSAPLGVCKSLIISQSASLSLQTVTIVQSCESQNWFKDQKETMNAFIKQDSKVHTPVLKKQPKHVPTSRWYSKTNFYVSFQQFRFSLKGKQKRESLNSWFYFINSFLFWIDVQKTRRCKG